MDNDFSTVISPDADGMSGVEHHCDLTGKRRPEFSFRRLHSHTLSKDLLRKGRIIHFAQRNY